MTSSVLILASLVAVCVALVCAVFATVAPQGRARSSLAWGGSVAGVSSVAAAALGGSTRRIDLAAVAGVVLLGGAAGAGWSPRGRSVLLALGTLGFAAGLYARFLAFTQLFDGGDVLGQLTWGIARSSGFVSFFAATGAVVLGARRPSALPIGGLPARVYALHRALGIVAIVATAVHLASLWADDFVEFTWGQLLFLPWTSEYEPFAVTLGWLAMISLALTAASGGLRRFLPGWRIVHALAYLTFALGLAHGLLAGSDSGTPWALAFYAATLLAVAWTLWRRFSTSSGFSPRGRRNWVKKDLSPAPDSATRARASATAERAPRGPAASALSPKNPPGIGRAGS